ncbi:MAG: class I SAM-dependent methyltransferase [Marmoricola sp.]
MTSRSLSFGAEAARYQRYRPDYPRWVLDEVLAYASGPVTSAVEVGAGTGKATRLFAGHGIEVTAVEPDPKMLEILHVECAGLPVHPICAMLEEMPPQSPVDLVYAAAAWHWTNPATRWVRVGALLSPGGTFASFGAPMELADDDLVESVEQARRDLITNDDVQAPPSVHCSGGLPWPQQELLESRAFSDVDLRTLDVTRVIDVEDYVGNLSTVSAYLLLGEHDRDVVLQRIRAVLPDRVEVRLDIALHLARRTDEPL